MQELREAFPDAAWREYYRLSDICVTGPSLFKTQLARQASE